LVSYVGEVEMLINIVERWNGGALGGWCGWAGEQKNHGPAGACGLLWQLGRDGTRPGAGNKKPQAMGTPVVAAASQKSDREQLVNR
jgi:hypothetical protein